MITLQNLKWNNCFSYADGNELNLSDTGLTQVLGTNGVGKSSIPLIIEEVLFNKNSKGTKKADIPNRNLDSSYSMELSFLVDYDEYVITVERKKTLKIVLIKNGENISSHTATNTFKTIEGILGVDFKTFSQLVYQNTNSSLQFLTATDTNRKRFLIDLLNLDKYVEYFETFKALVKEHNTKVVTLQAEIDTLQKWLSENNLEGMVVLSPLNLEINTEEDEKALGSLSVEFENITSSNRKISQNNVYKKQLDAIDMGSVAEIAGSVVDYEDMTEQLGQLKSEISSDLKLQKKYLEMSSECPTCGQPIDNSFAEAELDKLGLRLVVNQQLRNEIELDILNISKQNKQVKLKEKTEKEFESLYKAIDSDLAPELLDANSLQRQIAELEINLKEKRNKIEEVIKENAKRDRNNTRISVIQEQTDNFEKQLKDASNAVAEVETVYKNLEILKKSFSTNGLLAYKIEYLVKELETIVNEYLSELSDGRFTLTFAVTNDKLNVEITDEGKLVEILSLSSGELARVNTSTLLAIRRLMSSISKSQINVLFLDEVMGVLDEPGRERLVDVLVRETKLNTFIVSHEWSHPLLSKLHIVKENNISRLIKD